MRLIRVHRAPPCAQMSWRATARQMCAQVQCTRLLAVHAKNEDRATFEKFSLKALEEEIKMQEKLAAKGAAESARKEAALQRDIDQDRAEALAAAEREREQMQKRKRASHQSQEQTKSIESTAFVMGQPDVATLPQGDPSAPPTDDAAAEQSTRSEAATKVGFRGDSRPRGLKKGPGKAGDLFADARAQARAKYGPPPPPAAASSTATGEQMQASSKPEEEESEEVQLYALHSRVLLDILNARPDTFEDVLEEHSEHITVPLLKRLADRIAIAEKAGESEEVIEAMIVVLRRLQSHIERQEATPAMRLLDDVLRIMTSDVGDDEDVRFNYAVTAMERAFSGGGLPPGADIFQIAKEIGETGTTRAEKDLVEFVPRQAFVEQLGALLVGADERAAELHAALNLKKREVLKAETSRKLVGDELKACKRELAEAQATLQSSEETVRWLAALLKAAKRGGTDDSPTGIVT